MGIFQMCFFTVLHTLVFVYCRYKSVVAKLITSHRVINSPSLSSFLGSTAQMFEIKVIDLNETNIFCYIQVFSMLSCYLTKFMQNVGCIGLI
jgi:hypothetical protein